MQRDQVRKILEEDLEDLLWRYKFLDEGEIVEFTNVEIGSPEEELFLDDLDADGAERLVEGSGRVSYLFSRSDGKLYICLSDSEGKKLDEEKEVSEKEALRVFGNSGKKEEGFEGLLDIFKGRKEKKGPVSNNIRILTDSINDIKLESPEKSKYELLRVDCEEYLIVLRENGGCRLISEKSP